MKKKKPKRKITKIRKNPLNELEKELGYKEFIDEHAIRLLRIAILSSNLRIATKKVSEFLTYKNIGYDECGDCLKNYVDCVCELCPECGYNNCMCHFNTFDKLRIYITELVILYLNKKQLKNFITYLSYTDKIEPFLKLNKYVFILDKYYNTKY